MRLSIVATLYNSAPYITEFCQRASAAAQQLVGDDYEIILVNDGSPDNSLDIAVQHSMDDTHIIVIDLSRNFGHHPAMKAGLEYCRGEKVFLIDVDLEEEPEYLIKFSEQMTSEELDVVYGVQQKRKGGWFEKLSGSVFYTVFNWLSNIDHPRNILTVRLMTRRYVNALLSYKEREMVISCLWVLTGFKQSSHTVKKHMSSKSTYTLLKKLDHFQNAITSFSVAPLKIIFLFGLFIFVVSILFAFFLIVNHFFLSHPAEGWASIMVSVWVLGGLIISFIGIIGLYLGKVFSETKQRPYVIVREIYGNSKQEY